MRSLVVVGLAIGISGCFISIEGSSKHDSWHSLDNRPGGCSSIYYGPTPVDQVLSPSVGECALQRFSSRINLDKRGLSNISKPRLHSSKGYYDNKEIVKYELTYALAAPSFYPDGADGAGEYLDQVKDWNTQLDCTAKEDTNRRTYELSCNNNSIKISARNNALITDAQGRQYRLFLLSVYN